MIFLYAGLAGLALIVFCGIMKLVLGVFVLAWQVLELIIITITYPFRRN
jgi:hypothetical protein